MLVADPVRALTPAEAAKRLNVNVRTVYRLIQDGKIKAVRIGDLYRIHPDNVDAFLRGKEQNAGE